VVVWAPNLEPVWEVRPQCEGLTARRLSMSLIMARRMKAAALRARRSYSREPAAATDPGQRPLHDPVLREHDKAVLVAAADNLQVPGTGSGDGGSHLRSLVAGIGDQALDEGKLAARLVQYGCDTVPCPTRRQGGRRRTAASVSQSSNPRQHPRMSPALARQYACAVCSAALVSPPDLARHLRRCLHRRLH
jgi:hypothetical protein